jgi:hypothetical protein
MKMVVRIKTQVYRALRIDLRDARTKTAIGSLTSLFEFRCMNRGRFSRMLREHGPDDAEIGRVPVVVRSGESLLHGEGEQPGRLAVKINRLKRSEDY